MVRSPVVYIGYPKAASTYMESYFSAHPDVQVVHTRVPNFDVPTGALDIPDDGAVRVCINEQIA